MSSSFRTLRALLVAVSSCSLALSLSPSSPALSKRSFGDYIDNLIYLDANQTALWSAISYGEQTYAAALDNKWDGLLLHGANVTGNSSTSHSITIDALSVTVTDGRAEIGFLQDDISIEYFDVPQWPSTLPTHGVGDVGNAYIGLDINNGMSPIYYYFDSRWPTDYSKWFYDVVITYDWEDATANTTDVDFAGVIVAGQTLSWEDFLGISSSDVQQYGLPDTKGIDSQPAIYLTNEGTFYIDNTFTVNGNSASFNSSVPKTQSGKVVADIYFSKRWSTFPDDIVKALYGGLSGAKYTPDSTFGFWTIPCDSKVSFSFSIDGKTYDVDPAALIAPNPWGDQCIGSIFTKGQAVAAVPEFDIIFGFQFVSAFYLRAGINHDNNKPYYKMLPMQSPSGGWDSGVSVAASSMGYSTGASGATTTYSSATALTSATGSASTAYTYATDPSSTTAYTYGTDPASSASNTFGADPSGTAAVKAAGNLAETDDDNLNNQLNYYKSKAKTYEIVMVVLASVLGVGIVAAIAAIVSSRRRKGSAPPSAYRNIHEAEFNEPKAALYDAEGGHSRYSDPYHDTQ
ncbi:hypothetical protein L226DRAFT_564896 [Lentinus tigrinus ALCF2SS1-7]|uniref:uncharacterized protein n=1 Tax=Lentinus tigrinus ALCF2SS1-7 TaxID=1328758 RepID=UPI001165FCFD|nr:hypothetical protein L226DRAFT_564896 [Lentinus tigrinus ALCF2SS1-7]